MPDFSGKGAFRSAGVEQLNPSLVLTGEGEDNNAE
jgi:hypothetical protein